MLTGVAYAQVSERALPQIVTIDQAVREALDRNLGLLAARFNVTIAEAGLISARLRPNPVLSLGGDHLDLLGTGYNEENGAGPPEYSVRTDFVLERGGKRQGRIEVAENTRLAAEFGVLNTARQIILDVQNAFIDLQFAKDSVKLAQENLQALNDVVNINTLRVKSGDLAEVELLRSRVAALQFQNQVRQAELRVRTARNKLQLLLGRRRLAESFEIAGALRQDPGPASAEQAQELARKLRPDLQALFRSQARSQAELRLQIAQGKVDYTIGTEYRRQQGLAGKGNSLGFFFSTNIPVFNRNQGEIERVRREQRQIEARVRELEANIAVEIENAYEQVKTASTLVVAIEKDMLSQARDVRNITEFSYKRGEATLVEFLDAQRAFNDTIQGYNEARAEYARSLYLIEATAGQTPSQGSSR